MLPNEIFTPTFSVFSVAFFPLQIGDHVFIGEGSIVNAAVVNSYVYIGKNVVIVMFELCQDMLPTMMKLWEAAWASVSRF